MYNINKRKSHGMNLHVARDIHRRFANKYNILSGRMKWRGWITIETFRSRNHYVFALSVDSIFRSFSESRSHRENHCAWVENVDFYFDKKSVENSCENERRMNQHMLIDSKWNIWITQRKCENKPKLRVLAFGRGEQYFFCTRWKNYTHVRHCSSISHM